MDLGSSFVADEQSFHLVEPADRAFDDPTVSANPRTVFGVAASDHRLDASGPDQAAVLVVVVAAVGDHHLGSAAGPAREAGDGGTRSSSGSSWVTSLRLPPVSVQASGVPCASVRRWCLEPARPLSTGLGPVSEPPYLSGWSRVNGRLLGLGCARALPYLGARPGVGDMMGDGDARTGVSSRSVF